MLLLQDRGWELPEEEPPPRPPHHWHLPWRPLTWFAAWCWLMALVPVVDDAVGGLAGYVVLLAALGLVLWRADRWLSRQYWHGLREFKN